MAALLDMILTPIMYSFSVQYLNI